MKIVSWNINGYRSITGQNPSRRYDKVTQKNHLFKYIEEHNPDILLLQEIRATVDQIESDLLSHPYYKISHFNTCEVKKGYSGVAIFSKTEPLQITDGFGIKEFDEEGRVIQAEFKDFILFNVYFPKGYTDSERLDYKLRFYDSFLEYLNKILKKGKPIIVSGDYNTAHKEIDLARPKENINTSGFLEVERKKIDNLINAGFVDTFRLFCKEGGHYTWWSQRGRAREKNIGWRIDYHFTSEDLVKSISKSYHQPEILNSDHCPIVLELDI